MRLAEHHDSYGVPERVTTLDGESFGANSLGDHRRTIRRHPIWPDTAAHPERRMGYQRSGP